VRRPAIEIGPAPQMMVVVLGRLSWMVEAGEVAA
jgi:hypothetical protein